MPTTTIAEPIEVTTLASAKPVEEEFLQFRSVLEELKSTAETLTVTSEDDSAGMELARKSRLSLRAIRIAVEKRREELKADSLRRGQRIDAAAKALREAIEPLEARLLDQEKFAERAEAARVAALQSERTAFLMEEGAPSHLLRPDLGSMAEADWGSLLSDARAIAAARLAQQAKEAAEREAAAKAAELERQKAALELAATKAKAEQERKRFAEERAEADRIAAEERAAAEKEAAALRAKAAEERAAREKAEEAVRVAKLADDARKAQEQALAKAEAEAAAKAAKAPDAERISAYTRMIRESLPTINDAALRGMVEDNILPAVDAIDAAIRKLSL